MPSSVRIRLLSVYDKGTPDLARDNPVGTSNEESCLPACGLIGGEGTCPLRQGGCPPRAPQMSQSRPNRACSLMAPLTSLPAALFASCRLHCPGSHARPPARVTWELAQRCPVPEHVWPSHADCDKPPQGYDESSGSRSSALPAVTAFGPIVSHRETPLLPHTTNSQEWGLVPFCHRARRGLPLPRMAVSE